MTLATATRSADASVGGPQPHSPVRPGSPAVDRMSERRAGRPTEKAQFRLGRSPVLAFGRFRSVVHSRELTVDGVPVPIGSRALEVLAVLIEAQGELVT